MSKSTRALVGALLTALLSATVIYAPTVEAKGKPTCHPKGKNGLPVCETTTTSTTGPTTSSTSTTTTSTTVPTTTTTVPVGGDLLWYGNADTDVDLGDQTNCMDKNVETNPTSRLSIVADPLGQNGDVYQAQLLASDIDAGRKRAEWNKAIRDCNGDTNDEITLWGEGSPPGDTLYIGWRSLFGGTIVASSAENGGNYLQWKGNSSCGGPAVGMTVNNNRLSLRTIDGDPPGTSGLWMDTQLLSARMGAWHDFVMGVNFAKDGTGWIEFWVDGVKQTMSDGTTRHEGPTVCPDDTWVRMKFGVYGFDDGAPIHWLEDPRIGTSYSAVAP